MATSLDRAVTMLDMSLTAAKHVMHSGEAPLQRRLAWIGSELERLAAEAYRLADEAGDDPGSDPCREPIPAFDQPWCGHWIVGNVHCTLPTGHVDAHCHWPGALGHKP